MKYLNFSEAMANTKESCVTHLSSAARTSRSPDYGLNYIENESAVADEENGNNPSIHTSKKPKKHEEIGLKCLRSTSK